jgi:hypothetical protein
MAATMKLITMESEIWWLARADDIRPVRGLTIHQLARRIQETFSFVTVPTTLPAEGQPFAYRDGMFQNGSETISVRLFESFNDGVHVKVDSTTDDADIVFNKLRQIAVELGGKEEITPLLSYHVSTIVAEFRASFDSIIKDFSDLAKLISDNLDIHAEVGLRGIHFGADQHNLPLQLGKINPTAFRIENRFDAKFEEKRYFSVANMTTTNHIKVLEALDSVFARK